MNEKEFLEAVKEALVKQYGAEAEIKIQNVRKNNNVQLQGLLIQKHGSNIAPTIYLNPFYDMYRQGVSLEEIVDRIIDAYEHGKVKENIDMEFFRDFEQVRDRIVYRLINVHKNRELLKEIPHIIFLDLAICFYYAFHCDALGDGMILIYNNHMEMWGTNHQELMKLAVENTGNLFPPTFITLEGIVENMSIQGEADPEPGEFYVVTNEQKVQGAACILYPGLLERIAEKMGGSFYMIPSSVHEVIVFKDTGKEDIEYLQTIIRETNHTQLEVEDVLSEHPYYYDREKKRLMEKTVF